MRRAALRLSMVTETAVMKVIRTRIPMTDISNADKASCGLIRHPFVAPTTLPVIYQSGYITIDLSPLPVESGDEAAPAISSSLFRCN